VAHMKPPYFITPNR